ncbi:hypothetical protein Ahy_B03g061918 isoform B [Arachis hypogaea]|uniref:Uncharacterized protein n=1 Tax=Arachis hypogaea TaxID=3818 RepID=A0A444ZSG3_ARAHY|nr:hypothetical protein Ahy_B03g061918 isoform B [Arachis hypogaea]
MPFITRQLVYCTHFCQRDWDGKKFPAWVRATNCQQCIIFSERSVLRVENCRELLNIPRLQVGGQEHKSHSQSKDCNGQTCCAAMASVYPLVPHKETILLIAPSNHQKASSELQRLLQCCPDKLVPGHHSALWLKHQIQIPAASLDNSGLSEKYI